MANAVGKPIGDTRNWLNLHIDDFTPGIYDASFVAGSEPILPAPVGCATRLHTWCCTSYPTGGIGPLPRLSDWYETAITHSYPTTGKAVITMMIVNPGVSPPEIIYSFEIQNTGTKTVTPPIPPGAAHYYTVYSYTATNHKYNSLIHSQTNSYVTGGGIFASPFPFWTRIGKKYTPTTTKTSNPFLVFPASISTDPHGVHGHIFVYPDPSNLTAYGVYDLVKGATSTSDAGSGQVFGYDGRVVCLSATGTKWPGGKSFTRNETICWTDPPQTLKYKDQRESFVPENPFGYGAWGSVSAGELFLIKKWGGGVFITGDIDTPTSVVNLTGVEPIGDIVGRACASEEGTYYCAQNRGAWVWNGGNTSQKISTQIDDNFFTVEVRTGIKSNNMGFFVQKWGTLIVFSANYVWNRRSNSWWSLYPNKQQNTTRLRAKRNFFHFCPGKTYKELFASPMVMSYTTVNGTRVATYTKETYTKTTPLQPFLTTYTHFLYKFTSEQGATLWQWKSLPIQVSPDAEHVVDIRRLLIRVSQPTQKGTATKGHITVNIGTTTFSTKAGTIPATTQKLTPNPRPFRFNLGANDLKGLTFIAIQITSYGTGTSAAPILHSLDLEYELRAHLRSSN